MSCPQPETDSSPPRPARSAVVSAPAHRSPAPSIPCRQVSPAYGGQMTAVHDKAGETGIDVAETPSGEEANAACHEAAGAAGREAAGVAGRDAVTREVCRGVGRLLRAHAFAVINELSLANRRRADVVGLSPSGDI